MDCQESSASGTLSSTYNSPAIAPKPKKIDDVYFFDIIVFEVQNILFRVPKNGFQVAGSFFETMFSLPQPEGKIAEGSDVTCPLLLRGISKAHFRGFLRVLYPFNGTATTYEEWVGALHLATVWDFKEIRKSSVRALSVFITSKNVVEKILLAKKYGVKQWLWNGYSELIQQTGPVEIDELHSLNLDLLTIARICSIRERTCCSNCGMRIERSVERVNAEIARTFAEEIKGMEDFKDNLPAAPGTVGVGCPGRKLAQKHHGIGLLATIECTARSG